MSTTRLGFAAFALAAPLQALAVNTCELDGQPINLNNGNETRGKSGLIRCRDSDGRLQREQQLQNGVTMGVMRFYRQGVLEQEFNTNERGNQEGRSRTFAATPGAKNPLLREETMRNGSTVGVSRRWTADGALSRLSFHADDGVEKAVVEFTKHGRLAELRCAARPVFAPDADDASWCGFRKAPTTVELFSPSGSVVGRITHDHGERRQTESFRDDGSLREQTEAGPEGGVERRFGENGVKRREVTWVVRNGNGRSEGGRGPRIVTLEQEFHESGSLVHERRWQPTDRGSEPVLDQNWYLNGQPRDKTEYLLQDGRRTRRDTRYHDNGALAFEGVSLVTDDDRSLPIGMHQHFDAAGALRFESTYDALGHLTRQREFDAAGRVTQDDQVFEDGSRKAFAK